ncbi:MAG TPA: metallophosphoesterase [Bradyrhizobium sp.]|jgi:predicted phosphodiesterase|nr:metallophosphoesterase [Bradyrhizobium sp.]
MPLKLWVLSDLHMELTRGWDLPDPDARPQYDVLVVAGDLIPRMERGVRWLRDRVDQEVVFVPGNHEFYGCDIDRTVEKARALAAGTAIHVLQNETCAIGGVTFAGATLWTDFAINGDAHRGMAAAGDRMNDFKKIRTGAYSRRFLPHHALARHLQSRAFLEAEMRRPRGGRLVVVTHHAPVPEMPQAEGGSGEDPGLDPSFRSDLTMLMSPAADEGCGALRPADLWIYGHTHESLDVRIGATRVVCNAKGYGPWPPRDTTWDNPRFDPNYVIEI